MATAATALGLCLWQARRLTPARTVLFVLACWTTWQLVFGPGTERNTFALIAPLAGWALVVAVLERRAVWLMTLSYALMIIASIGWVEDIRPCLLAMHPVGVMLFFAWFALELSFRSGRRVRQLAAEYGVPKPDKQYVTLSSLTSSMLAYPS